jgi:3-hydroxy acid dehydrogenase/malonic semialdehyde reductase
VLPVFKARPEGGRGDVIFIGSLAGRDPYVGGTVSLDLEFGGVWLIEEKIYCSSKAAVRAFSDALRRELVGTRIRVMTVDPGQVLTVGLI